MEPESTLAHVAAGQLGCVEQTPEMLEFMNFALTQMKAAGPLIFALREDVPVEHLFTSQLYTRTIHIKGPAILATRVHLKEHPFIISMGCCYVWTATEGVQVLVAHHKGVTQPGTFRLLYVPEEVTWSTFHVTDLTDPEEIVQTFTMEPRILKLHE